MTGVLGVVMKIIKADNIDEIMKLITSEYSWEQVIYKIIAWEGLNPWDLDIKALSSSFAKYIIKMKQLDFKVPAKYVVIAAVLLRMKSDHIEFLDFLNDYENQESPESDLESETAICVQDQEEEFVINSITVPPKRRPVRRIMVTELITALRKALETDEKRKLKGIRRKGKIELRNQDVVNRISYIYERIESLLSKIKKEEKKELTFSELVGKWNRKNVLDNFLPLIFLDHEKKVNCRQENMFDEIYITRGK